METPARKAGKPMSQLEDGIKDCFGSKSRSKRSSNINLYENQWAVLDELSEEAGISRNQVIREIIALYIESRN